jgi:superfamily II DNA or RNA helicase
VSRRRPIWEEDDWLDPDLDDDIADFPPDIDDLPALVPPSRSGTLSPKNWAQRLTALSRAMQGPGGVQSWPRDEQILYVVDVAGTMQNFGLAVEVQARQRKQDGSWREPRAAKIQWSQIATLPDEADRRILALLMGAKDLHAFYGSPYTPYGQSPHTYRLSAIHQDTLLPMMCATGRCMLRLATPRRELCPLGWDDGPPWEPWLEARRAPHGGYLVSADLRRETERIALAAPAMLVAGGLVFTTDKIARLSDGGLFPWISVWRQSGDLSLPADKAREWLGEVLALPAVPRLGLPPELAYEESTGVPRPRLLVRAAKTHRGDERLGCHLSFDYDGAVVPAAQSGRGVFQPDRRRLILRDAAAERAHAARLSGLGIRPPAPYVASAIGARLVIAPGRLSRAVTALLAEGWHVEAEGRRYRRPGSFHLEIGTGVDWFELRGQVDFEGTTAALPELLAALRRGENTVRLGDGTYGVLPEEWLRRVAPLAGFGHAEGADLRFTRAQVGLLDALLAAQPDIACDETFARAREELRRFDGVRAAEAPPDFVGTLRPYQREGLGWLQFLARFGFGGCLADDMGLGKTIMVLALLDACRERRARLSSGPERPGPALAVVPRSLVFNWKQEAARFTPKLRILDHTGAGRLAPGEHFDDYDLVVTTYGTLRRDAAAFARTRFEYAILDEAQAIKNAGTGSAKAARLIRADHRLALSGTPIENHLGELWSLFEFLNPGMLGKASVFQDEGGGLRNPDEATRQLLARALRPFVLRRTKEQVARDLPAKWEQTLSCELESAQRASYEELRRHYRQSLLGRLELEGLARMKIHVLEALLRLRQAACHPGLIDPRRAGEGSAKLDALLPRLAEVVAEGHKALVFSQFVSFLTIVRDRLRREGIEHEYLDGRTRDRAERVARFQTDPGCALFLISLKAGGLGLNLTAADYVFLLDPWWNPAVEAQAIDRTHRIGQTRQVFAYRLIARDTVEEKILELQQDKRALADAILGADGSLIRSLTRADLELLLS